MLRNDVDGGGGGSLVSRRDPQLMDGGVIMYYKLLNERKAVYEIRRALAQN